MERLIEHPEALSGHHLAAQYLEEIAAVYNDKRGINKERK